MSDEQAQKLIEAIERLAKAQEEANLPRPAQYYPVPYPQPVYVYPPPTYVPCYPSIRTPLTWGRPVSSSPSSVC
ncbi:MAG: hypothetical protein KGL39_03730 [Patescibacteria group bacterium]|nr:hypothetical protein [Patescibacteria group bacterium]